MDHPGIAKVLDAGTTLTGRPYFVMDYVAGKPITVKVKNNSAKAMEFESTSLRVEKVVAAGSEGVVNVRALKPGRYEFYDDFNDKARGALTVQ